MDVLDASRVRMRWFRDMAVIPVGYPAGRRKGAGIDNTLPAAIRDHDRPPLGLDHSSFGIIPAAEVPVDKTQRLDPFPVICNCPPVAGLEMEVLQRVFQCKAAVLLCMIERRADASPGEVVVQAIQHPCGPHHSLSPLIV